MLSYSVGKQIAMAAWSVVLGFVALLVFRTTDWRGLIRSAEQDAREREGTGEEPTDAAEGAPPEPGRARPRRRGDPPPPWRLLGFGEVEVVAPGERLEWDQRGIVLEVEPHGRGRAELAGTAAAQLPLPAERGAV